MRIFQAMGSGASRSVRIWKGLLTVWLFLLMLVSLFALPLKTGLKSGLGNSMITEKLAEGINVEVFTDMGQTWSTVFSALVPGFFIVLLFGFLMNVFFTGGIFSTIRGSAGKFLISDFFRASARNFWSFLVISIMIGLIILGIAFIIIGIPLSMASQSITLSEAEVYLTGMIAVIVFCLLMPVILLVADYSRAWQASSERLACFKALGYGFSRTFKTLLKSYPLMIMLLLPQVLFGWLVLTILPDLRPSSGMGLFLLFVLTQLLFFMRLLLKAWRYASVTGLAEQNAGKTVQQQPEQAGLN